MTCLWQKVRLGEGKLIGRGRTIALGDILVRDWPIPLAEKLRGSTVLVDCASALSAALALVHLDGLAQRVVLAPQGSSTEQLLHAAASAHATAVVTDKQDGAALSQLTKISVTESMAASPAAAKRDRKTEWVLFTSGSTGLPKLVVHTLETLIARIVPGDDACWGTFYDIRRYGGLVILLRALLSGASLVVAEPGEPVDSYLARVQGAGCRRLTGTPSHWRRAMMSPVFAQMDLDYVRLSGEIADQAILDKLRNRLPDAKIVHAFASTEAGLAFEVNDGKEGFPDSVLQSKSADFEIKVANGTLRLRSPGAALEVLGGGPVRDLQGFVDTNDVVRFDNGRFYFEGRRDQVINVGGDKFYPEEIEAILNRHPNVRISRVRGRKNPVLGALSEAEVVLGADGIEARHVLDELTALCAAALPQHKRPVAIRVVETLPVSQSGKLDRLHA